MGRSLRASSGSLDAKLKLYPASNKHNHETRELYDRINISIQTGNKWISINPYILISWLDA